MTKTLIIAEAGVNHNGDEGLALDLILKAYESGADIIKFQTFKARNLVTSETKQADYQQANTGKEQSQLALLERLELSFDSHFRLLKQCDKLGIEFLSTAFDGESLLFLVNELKLKRLKIPSGDLTNSPLLLAHARTGCELLVSTGMASLAEVEFALGVIAFGYLAASDEEPSPFGFRKYFLSDEGQKALAAKVHLLHCTTEYPAPMKTVNLRAMDTLASAFNLPVGYSDHTDGVEVAVAAVARGAKIIEKHFTLDKSMDGPDHIASLNPEELSLMIRSIRNVEQSLGRCVKGPCLEELKNMAVGRKSLIAGQKIKAGDVFTEDNIVIKRPGTGISPEQYWDYIGRKSLCSYSIDEVIDE